MKTHYVTIVLVCAVLFCSPLHAVEKQLEALEEAFVEEVVGLTTPEAKLEKMYAQKLSEIEAAAVKTGEQDKVKAIQLEKGKEKLSSVPTDAFMAFDDLKKLRGIFDRELTKKRSEAQETLTKLATEYSEKYDAMAKQLKEKGDAVGTKSVLAAKEESFEMVEMMKEELSEKAQPAAKAPKPVGGEIPTTKEEMIAFLTGSRWTWEGDTDTQAEFLKGQKLMLYEGNTQKKRWGPFNYKVTDDLQVLVYFKRMEFDDSFREFSVFKVKTNEKVSWGKLLSAPE